MNRGADAALAAQPAADKHADTESSTVSRIAKTGGPGQLRQ
jgi:hypothetical protein